MAIAHTPGVNGYSIPMPPHATYMDALSLPSNKSMMRYG